MYKLCIPQAYDLSLDELGAHGLLFRQLRILFHREKCSSDAHNSILTFTSTRTIGRGWNTASDCYILCGHEKTPTGCLRCYGRLLDQHRASTWHSGLGLV